MPQSGYTPIQLYRTTTASATPVAGDLNDGELAINLTDEKLYFKNASGSVKLLAANLTPVANGGTGAVTLTGYVKGNGTSAFTAAATIPASDIASGAALTKSDDTNVTLTLGGSPSSALLAATSLSLGWTGQLSVARGGTGAATLTGYVKGSGTSALTASATVPTSDLTGTVAVANGGTALSSTPTNGQLLIGNGTNYTLATLTQGSGITITNAAGAITIAATAASMVYPGAGIAVSTGSAWGTSLTAPSGTIVGTTDTQTLSNKTITGTKETVFAISDGASVDIDPANGGIQTWTLGASRTPSATNFVAGQSVTLMVDDGSAYSINWSTIAPVWKTDGGSAPTLNTSGYTAIQLWKVSTTVYGARVGNN